MKPRVYVETSVFSYLAARPSRDTVTAGNQASTQEWWSRRRDFDLYVSVFVLQEAQAGDPLAAKSRLEALNGIEILEASEKAYSVAESLLLRASLPPKARLDALHIGVAAYSGMDYLATWNCSHIANPAFRSKIETVIRSFNLEPPIICTPQELVEV